MILDSIKSSLCLGKSLIYDIYLLNPNLWEEDESSGCIQWNYKLTKDGGLEKDEIILHVVAYFIYDSQWRISYFWSWLINGHIYFSQNIFCKKRVVDTFVRETLDEVKNNARLDDFKKLSIKDDVKIVENMLIKSGFFKFYGKI